MEEKISFEDVYLKSEYNANKFNLYVFIEMSIFGVFCIVLGIFRVFPIKLGLMIPGMSLTLVSFLTPVFVYLFHDKIIHKCDKSVLYHSYFKRFVIASSFTGCIILCTLYSFHAIPMVVLPMLMGAQYRVNKTRTIVLITIGVLMVPLTVYASYFVGVVDRNFIKDFLDYDQAVNSVAYRVENTPASRYLDLFTHYCLPRMFGVAATYGLTAGVISRNQSSLEATNRLATLAQEEMSKRNNMQSHVIESLAGVIEARDTGTGEHVIRTKHYISLLAKECQKHSEFRDILTDKEIELIVDASPLHDIGKIAISDKVLLKPGKLTDEEFDEMKKHSAKGGEMIRTIFANLEDKEFLDTAYDIAVYHHEKWNGRGYPKGLKEEEIPISARLMAIADVYDALVSPRVYKDPMPPEKAMNIILSESGAHFDPKLINVLETIQDKFIKAAVSNISDIKG